MLSSLYGIILQGDQPATQQVDYIEHPPSWKGQWFILIGININFGCEFSFPVHRVLSQHHYPRVYRAPHLRHGILYGVAFKQPTRFTMREVRKWAHYHGIHYSYDILCHPEASGVIECWNSLLKAQPQWQFRAILCKQWDHHQGCSVSTESETLMWHCVWEPMAGSRSSLTYYHAQ